MSWLLYLVLLWPLGCRSFGIRVVSKHMPRSGTAGSCGNFICNFLSNFHTVLHSGCTSLHSHWNCRRFSFLLTVSKTVIWRLFNNGRLTSVGWCLTVVLICISLIISRVKPLFVSLLAIFMSLGYVYLGLLPMFWLNCLGFFVTELHELFVYFRNYPLFGYIVCKCFLPVCRLPFHLVYGFLFWVKASKAWSGPICLFLLLFLLPWET